MNVGDSPSSALHQVSIFNFNFRNELYGDLPVLIRFLLLLSGEAAYASAMYVDFNIPHIYFLLTFPQSPSLRRRGSFGGLTDLRTYGLTDSRTLPSRVILLIIAIH